MGGRARPNLRDGEWVGYRKTSRRQSPRTPLHLLPNWTLSFELPPDISLRPGFDPGLIGVAIDRGHVDVTGKNKAWVERQAIAFLKSVKPFGLGRPLSAMFTRDDEPGPTISGPIRKGGARTISLWFNGQNASMVEGGVMRMLNFS